MTSPKRLAAMGGGAPPVYIEDVFSTYLYTGTGATRTITNGIDLLGKGGLVWFKHRNQLINHALYDTERGATKSIFTNATDAQFTWSDTLTGFTSSGFTLGADGGYNYVNNNGFPGNTNNYTSWTFRKQAKFFDVVTYTGNGGTLAVTHALASTPGCVFIKRTNSTSDWVVGHRGSGSYWASSTLRLNTTGAGVINGEFAAMSDTTVTVVNSGAGYGDVNTNGATYVMYLFAHNAGGFGALGTDNVISCGTFTTDGSGNATVNLGYEPQFIINKATVAGYSWEIGDSMRGLIAFTSGGYSRQVKADLTNAEGNYTGYATSTGFEYRSGPTNTTFIYVAIRRGPMKTPTSGTSVFGPVARTGTGAATTVSGVGFTPDLAWFGPRSLANNKYMVDRLRGVGEGLISNSSFEGVGLGASLRLDVMDGIYMADGNDAWNQNASTYVNWFFRRVPGFMDIVCYTGTGVAGRSVTHNLGAKPLINFIKKRNVAAGWIVYTDLIDGSLDYLSLNTTAAKLDSAESPPTSTLFYLSNGSNVNAAGDTYVAYPFGDVSGVSKCGVYTGTGAAQTINCGFSAGARFVLIKRTDSTGDWYVWDTARGIISGNDPYLLVNSNVAEVTNTDYLSVQSSGFGLTASAPAALNANGGKYLYLAIA